MQRRYILFFLSFFIFHLLTAQNSIKYNGEDGAYTTGLELMDKGNFASARALFEQYAVENNGFKKANAEYYAAFCALSLYHGDGEVLVSDFIKDYPRHPKALLANYELGNFYFKDKKYDKAIEYLQKVETSALSKEQRLETNFRLGYSHFTKRDFKNALASFNKIKNARSQYSAAASYYAGYIEYQDGEYDKALKDFLVSEKSDTYSAIVPYMIANVYYRQGRYDDLIGYTTPLLKSGKNYNKISDIYLLTAESYFKKGDYKKSSTYFEGYLANNKSAPKAEVLYRIGYIQYLSGDNKKAIENLKPVASTAANDTIGVYASYYLGILYLKEGNSNFAITAFDGARKNKYNTTIKEEGAYQYAKLSYGLGRSNESIESFENFLEDFPGSQHAKEVNDLLSQAYLNLNNYNKAIAHIESLPSRSKKIDAAYQKATYLKGTEHFNKEEYSKAVSMFKKSLRYPYNPEYVVAANFWTAEAYAIGKKYTEAKKYYQNVIGSAEPDQEAYQNKAKYGIGYAYYNTNEYGKAKAYFKGYVGNPTNKTDKRNYNDALIRLADSYYVTKFYSEAVKYYSQSITFSKVDNDYSHLQIGVVNAIDGTYEKAISEFDKVIKKYKRSRYYDDAIFQKAQLNFQKGKYKTAAIGFSKLIGEKPQSNLVPYAYMKRASAYFNVQEYDKAIKDYGAVINQYTSHSAANEALLPLQEVLSLANRSGEFDTYLTRFKEANPDNKSLEGVEYETAKTLYFNEKYTQAVNTLKAYIRSYPKSSNVYEAKYYIAESYYRLKDYKGALKYYSLVLTDGKLPYLGRVSERMGNIESKNGNHAEAITHFRKLAGLASSKKELYAAWSGLMESHYIMASYDSTENYANLILEGGGVDVDAQNKATMYLGRAAYAKGDYETAKDEFLNTLNTAKDEFGAEAQYMLGKILYENKQYNQSIETLIELNNSFFAYEAWVGEGFLLIADNYVALEEYYQAKGTLSSIKDDFPVERIRKAATDKMVEVEALERKKNEIDTGKTDSLLNENN